MTASDILRSYFSAWERKDRPTLEALLAEDFTFTSPNDDDHIDVTRYFEKCWPGSANIQRFLILDLIDNGEEAFIRYECELVDGKRFRNTEYFRLADDKVREVDVYFGRDVTST
jgi:ketosteroid isomerase-like protein